MLRLAGIDVRAVSVGGVETCIDLPGYRLAFDIGRAPDFAVGRRTVLFTHAHMDHMGGIAWHCATRALRALEPPVYVVAPEHVAGLQALFAAWRSLDGSELPHEVVPLAPGAELDVGPDRFVRAFSTLHTVPCQGYVLCTRRRKLRTEHAGLPGEEIARRRERGETLTDPIDVPEVAFTGDTTIDVLDREPDLLAARLLILEVTMLDERVDRDRCRAMGHVHLDDVVANAERFRNEALLLTHFSPRYTPEEVRDLLARRLPPELARRTTALLPGGAA